MRFGIRFDVLATAFGKLNQCKFILMWLQEDCEFNKTILNLDIWNSHSSKVAKEYSID